MIAAMLFVSAEAVADTVDETVFHQQHHSHADIGDAWYPDSDGIDHDGGACEHFCHVHVVAVPQQVLAPSLETSGCMPPVFSSRQLTRLLAPPTPPPNP
jgi:hypothetical protein